MAGDYRPTTLITGGSGFLGSQLCDRLVADGHRVICIDSLLTGSAENVAHLSERPDFVFLEHDVTEPFDPEELVRGSGDADGIRRVDNVLHFASPASPKDYARHPIETLRVGALGTMNSLEVAKAHRAIFLLASSSEVYGDPELNPQPESYFGNVNTLGPRSVYDEAKRFAEAVSWAYLQTHGLDVRIARIFNTYGPRMRVDDGRAVPAFMKQAITGQSLAVYGDGSQTRSFCYVSDTVDGLMSLLTHRPKTGDRLVMNIGNPEEVTVLQLAREVIAVTGSASEIVFEKLPQDDPKLRRPDISRAREVLGWEPRVSRTEGLKKVLPYFRETLALKEGV